MFLPALGFILPSAHAVSHITPRDTLHWVPMPRCWHQGGVCKGSLWEEKAVPDTASSQQGTQPLSQTGQRMEKEKGVEGEAPGPEQIHPWNPWRKPGWSRYPRCISMKDICITTSHGELLVENIFFCEGCRSMGSTCTGAGKCVRRKECQKGTVMTTAMTPACHHPASLVVVGEEVEEQAGMKK